MSFRIQGLSPAPFAPLFGLSDAALLEHNARRFIATAQPGFPCRVALCDVAVGTPVLLLNYLHLDVSSPYRAQHAIYVQEGTCDPFDAVGNLPPVFRNRILSLRAYDDAGMMLDADLVAGDEAQGLIERLFAHTAVSFIHAHNAKRGCFSCRIDRA